MVREVIAMLVNELGAGVGRWARGGRERHATGSIGALAFLFAALLLAPSVGWSFGNGCGIYVNEELVSAPEQIFFARYADTLVLMQIDGELVTLKVAADESRGQLRDLGDVMHRVYANGQTSVQATFTVTRVCPPNARECDGVGISADFVVRTGDVTRNVIGRGVSGC